MVADLLIQHAITVAMMILAFIQPQATTLWVIYVYVHVDVQTLLLNPTRDSLSQPSSLSPLSGLVKPSTCMTSHPLMGLED